MDNKNIFLYSFVCFTFPGVLKNGNRSKTSWMTRLFAKMLLSRTKTGFHRWKVDTTKREVAIANDPRYAAAKVATTIKMGNIGTITITATTEETITNVTTNIAITLPRRTIGTIVTAQIIIGLVITDAMTITKVDGVGMT